MLELGSDAMVRVTIVAEGWVQVGVYRTFVKRVASNLGLKGLVRNLSNGCVEVFCEGTMRRINKFVKMVNCRGPRNHALSIYVESLKIFREGEKDYRGSWKKYKGFDIDYGFEVESPVDRALLENLESGTLYVASSRDEFGLFKNEFVMFRKETNGNFKTMEDKYGSISEEMKKMRGTLEKLVDAYIKRQT